MDLSAVLDGMVDAVFVYDTAHKLVSANRGALRLIGATDLMDVVGRLAHPWGMRSLRKTDGVEFSPITRALAGEAVIHELEVADHLTRGRICLRTRTAPIFEGKRVVGAVKVATDVTREYALDQLRDEFLRVAAHELRTPVTAIKSSVAAAVAVLGEVSPGAARLLDAVDRGADRIDRLVSSLLDVTELDGGILNINHLPFRIDAILDEELQRLPARDRARLRLSPSLPPLWIRGDERRIRQALHALVDNALRYSPAGSPIQLALQPRDGQVRFSIQDQGMGIPESRRAQIFEKYFRARAGTESDPGGLGVGLYVAREVLAQHGGRIWFESIENQGTQFFIELPAEPTPVAVG